MSQRSSLIVSGAALLALAALLLFMRWYREKSSPPAPFQNAIPAKTNAAVESGSADTTGNTEHSPLADELNAAGGNAPRDLEIVSELVRQTLLSLKEPYRPPLGLNEDFTRMLTGGNRLALAALPKNHPAINADGQLVDRWQTPLHFHPLSVDAVEIRSAGSDRKLFTADDVVRPGRAGPRLSSR